MKQISILSFALIFAIALFSSCQTEDAGGEQTDARDNIDKSWNVAEDTHSTTYGTSNYDVDITKNPSVENEIFINNFFSMGTDLKVTATYDDATRIILISEQTVDDNIIQGQGTVASAYNSIDFEYTVDDGAEIFNVTASYNESGVTATTNTKIVQ